MATQQNPLVDSAMPPLQSRRQGINMGYKAELQAIQAAERREQRKAQKRLRDLERQAKEQAKLSAIEQAKLEVETNVRFALIPPAHASGRHRAKIFYYLAPRPVNT